MAHRHWCSKQPVVMQLPKAQMQPGRLFWEHSENSRSSEDLADVGDVHKKIRDGFPHSFDFFTFPEGGRVPGWESVSLRGLWFLGNPKDSKD